MKRRETGIVTEYAQLTDDIFRLVVRCEAAMSAAPGQFCNLYMKDSGHLLPRPISICHIDTKASELTFVYRVVGEGTKAFSKLDTGATIDLLGPLGNGFTQVEATHPVLVGGGVGVPPMLGLAQAMEGKCTVVLGYRTAETFLLEEFEKTGATVVIATDDGSLGTHGTVVDAIRENDIDLDVIYSCGPKPMLRALKALAEEKNIPCYVSMEERMACGVGACLGCVCETKDVDDHSKVHNKRICKDGPVFEAREVIL
ncbi:MAG: dihydroorotate dehydrogenase electron transfer subunit [Lachnospiraceae bacterium]|nr:dihydroorotate dehydrogenase electron transfer subunit [Lachnospiraceae bacterium]MBQ2579445.1 dihydroorotate dehydrogenase electron transfer subunit [Lachnospiraceae bacterium]